MFKFIAKRCVEKWEWEEAKMGFAEDGEGEGWGPSRGNRGGRDIDGLGATELELRRLKGDGGKKGWKEACC